MADKGFSHARIREVEEAMFACRPALKTVRDGDWVWRFARGYTGRANCVQSLDVNDAGNAEARIARHVARSCAHGITPRFRITPLTGQEIISALDRQGWGQSGHTLVMISQNTDMGATLGEMGPTHGESSEIVCVSPQGEEWQMAARCLLGLDEETLSIYMQMMAVLPASARGFLQLAETGQPVCCALGVVAKGVVSRRAGSHGTGSRGVGALFSLTTDPAYRRKGLARRMTKQVHEWLRKKGARQYVLQVEAHNHKAVSLYYSLGYQRVYGYHYRTLKETYGK